MRSVPLIIIASFLPCVISTHSSVNSKISPETEEFECGAPKVSIRRKRIIGGTTATFGELPWQAHIRIAGFQCGGVLIDHYFVLTAAHCVHRARLSEITVFLGEHDTKNTGKFTESLPEEAFTVKERIIHPNFKYKVTQPDRFDLALLKLNRAVKYKKHILPICLPQGNENEAGEFKNHTGQNATVAGWGKTDTSYGKAGTNVLQKVIVPILSNDECRRWHQGKNIRVELHDEMFCAGYKFGKMDACLGDSGSPLILMDDTKTKWMLAGISSAGFGCGVDHQPGIYQNITSTVKWIKKQILI